MLGAAVTTWEPEVGWSGMATQFFCEVMMNLFLSPVVGLTKVWTLPCFRSPINWLDWAWLRMILGVAAAWAEVETRDPGTMFPGFIVNIYSAVSLATLLII